MKLKRNNSRPAGGVLSIARPHHRAAIFAAAALACVLLAGCRQDMHVQPKYLTYGPSTFFDDGRSARQPVEGTVARGHLRIDEQFYKGKVDGKLVDEFPFAITANDLLRGQQRYNIYCSPCHAYTGNGQGMIVQRGFPPPPSFHIDRLRQSPVGHFFDVMTNGYGMMYSYAARISPEDRWRIAAYIRALQLSEHASTGDVPDDARKKLEEQQP
jgi:mono/diheme cytochrome c family protein